MVSLALLGDLGASVVKGRLAVLLSLATLLVAQTAPKPAQKPLPWKSYCHPAFAFCFKYPADWSVLGEVFAGYGVAVAPPQKQEKEFWDAVTVAMVVPPPQGDEDPVTINQAISNAMSSVHEGGQSFETLQRQLRRVDGRPAELVKLRYIDKSSGREWIEVLVFVVGPDWEIYSVSLKCAPASLAYMEPLFLRIVDSWTLPVVQSPPGANDEDSAAGNSKAAPAAPPKSVPPKASPPPNP